MEDAADIQLEGTHLAVISIVLEKLDEPIAAICSEKYEQFEKFSECRQLLTKIYQFRSMIEWITLR